MAHFVYWAVFGQFNKKSIDAYHMEQMLKTILNYIKIIENRFTDNYVQNFIYDRNFKQKSGSKNQLRNHHSRHLSHE
jgi:hypothetical protein